MRIRYTAQCLEHCRNSMQVRYGYYLKCKVHYNLQSIPADMEQKEEKNSAKAEDEQSEGHKRPRESQCQGNKSKQYFRKTAESTSNATMIEKIINS